MEIPRTNILTRRIERDNSRDSAVRLTTGCFPRVSEVQTGICCCLQQVGRLLSCPSNTGMLHLSIPSFLRHAQHSAQTATKCGDLLEALSFCDADLAIPILLYHNIAVKKRPILGITHGHSSWCDCPPQWEWEWKSPNSCRSPVWVDDSPTESVWRVPDVSYKYLAFVRPFPPNSK